MVLPIFFAVMGIAGGTLYRHLEDSKCPDCGAYLILKPVSRYCKKCGFSDFK